MREGLRALGPYFALDDPASADGWLPVAALIATPEPLLLRSEVVRAALGGESVHPRVALSVAQLGLVARLLAPSFGAAVLEGRLLDPYEGWWRPGVGGPMPLAAADAAVAGRPVEGDLAAAVYDVVVDRVVAPVVGHAVAMSVSPRVLWGNVASAVAGAAAMVGLARPELAAGSTAFASALLDLGALRGTTVLASSVPEVPGVAGVRFRRRSCCLLYRTAPGSPKNVCGDCVLGGVKIGAQGQ